MIYMSCCCSSYNLVVMFSVVANLADVISVRVQSEEVKYGGMGYMVILLFSTGYSLGITETSVMNEDISYVHLEKLETFYG